MRQLSLMFIGGALVAVPAFADEGGYTAFVQAESVSWSDSFPISSILDGFETDSFERGGETSFTHNQVVIGAERGGFRAGLTARYDYYTGYSADTALLVNDSNNGGVQPGTYNLSIDLKEVQANGIQVGYAHTFSDTITVEARLSALTLQRLTDGRASGAITISDNDDVSGTALGDYRYSDNLLFSQEYPEPDGYGATVDVLVLWSPREDLRVRAAAYDAGSYLKWEDAPRTEFSADSATVTRETSGQLIVDPVLSGRDTQTDYLQRYYARYELDAEYDVRQKTAIGLNVLNIEAATLVETRAAYAVNDKLKVGASYEWQSGGAGVALNWRGLDLQISTDSFDAEKAKYAKAKIGWKLRF